MNMVFSSLPLYVDPPNFQQQGDHRIQQQATPTDSSSSSRLLIPPPPPAPSAAAPAAWGTTDPAASTSSATMRPGSMAERARMAKLPQPEAGLKCPRCDSSNTKFCYFNNYSLSQPRHFCKSCRRYWTRGGALRNVPVGGGCRRNNKRGKGVINVMSQSSSSTRPSPASYNILGSGCSRSGVAAFSTIGGSSTRLPCPLPPQLPFLLGGYIPAGTAEASSSLHIGGLGSDTGSGMAGDLGLLMSSGGLCQPPLRLAAAMQQFPFLTGLEPTPPPPPHPRLPPTPGELFASFHSGVDQGLQEDSASGMKMDQQDSTHGGYLNLSKNLLGISHHDHQQQQQQHHNHHGNDDQYNWMSATAGGAWPDLL